METKPKGRLPMTGSSKNRNRRGHGKNNWNEKMNGFDWRMTTLKKLQAFQEHPDASLEKHRQHTYQHY
ncbi:hypothetical protein D7Z54_28660 [Salibacterium salarium]|uniref:Uncharacterized protein n=1 Tax=Salibacterium salarium TaxID=284579 RepID=A0A428MUW6_9BACI|nr:hypothetical protein [Salibacterium salarium]RSL29912.1 hypothetical protein D7Z54_28660 [Salibacterium salarium]